MSFSTQRIAKNLGKSLRTVRRWCELGLIPGAYRKRGGGHWRVRRFRIQEALEVEKRVKGFSRRRSPVPMPFSEDTQRMIREEMQWQSNGGRKKLNEATDLLLAMHGFSKETLAKEKKTAEQKRILDDTPLSMALAPRIWRAAEERHSILHVAATKILARSHTGKGLNARALAKELKVSRMTLYRKFGKDRIRSTINLTLPGKRDLPNPNGRDDTDRLKGRSKGAPKLGGNKMQRDAEQEAKRIYPQRNNRMKKLLRSVYPHLKFTS
jgi:transposase